MGNPSQPSYHWLKMFIGRCLPSFCIQEPTLLNYPQTLLGPLLMTTVSPLTNLPTPRDLWFPQSEPVRYEVGQDECFLPLKTNQVLDGEGTNFGRSPKVSWTLILGVNRRHWAGRMEDRKERILRVEMSGLGSVWPKNNKRDNDFVWSQRGVPPGNMTWVLTLKWVEKCSDGGEIGKSADLLQEDGSPEESGRSHLIVFPVYRDETEE